MKMIQLVLCLVLTCGSCYAETTLESLNSKLDLMKEKFQQVDFLAYAMKFSQVDSALNSMGEKFNQMMQKLNSLEGKVQGSGAGNAKFPVGVPNVMSTKVEEYLRKITVSQKILEEDFKQQKTKIEALTSMTREGMKKIFEKIDVTEPRLKTLSEKVDLLDGKLELTQELFQGLQEQVESSMQKQAVEWGVIQGQLRGITVGLRTLETKRDKTDIQVFGPELGKSAWNSVLKISQLLSMLRDLEPQLSHMVNASKAKQICSAENGKSYPISAIEFESTHQVFVDILMKMASEVNLIEKPSCHDVDNKFDGKKMNEMIGVINSTVKSELQSYERQFYTFRDQSRNFSMQFAQQFSKDLATNFLNFKGILEEIGKKIEICSQTDSDLFDVELTNGKTNSKNKVNLSKLFKSLPLG